MNDDILGRSDRGKAGTLDSGGDNPQRRGIDRRAETDRKYPIFMPGLSLGPDLADRKPDGGASGFSRSCYTHQAKIGGARMSDSITVIREEERPVVDFVGGATYRAIVGDDTGAGLPIRTGIQTSPPGYATRVHSHPYVEMLTVIAGRGEAWLDGEAGVVVLEPGVTVMLPANRPHAFRVIGDKSLVTLGIHTFGKRIVNYKDASTS